jgi:hypothetical protein
MMADNHYVSCIAASYISFTNRPVKTGVSKLNYPLYPPWDWAEKSFRCYSHSANPLLTGVPAEGFGLLIVSARLQMFQPVKSKVL